MKEKPSLKAKKNSRTIYAFDIPSEDFIDALYTKEDVITALMEEHKPVYSTVVYKGSGLTPFSFDIFCYETEQQCLDAYDAFHKQFPSAIYIGRGKVHEN